MAPSFLSSGSKKVNPVKHFEIRPDESNLVLRGSREEAPSVLLRGTLVLCLSQPLRIQGIRLRFTGEKRIGFYHTGAGPNYVKQHDEMLRKTWVFRRTSETLRPGNYEWPFDLILSGDTPESLEGMTETWLVYRMKATIERGMFQQNVIARKQIRMIRTLDPSDLELSHGMAVENVWTDKISYAISTPCKAVMFGSTIRVDFKLIPLLKGLVIGNIVTELIQKQKLELRGNRSAKGISFCRAVAADIAPDLQDLEVEEIDGQDGYQFSRMISLPRSLRQCVQDFQDHGIKVKHHLAFKLQLHNPDGHISELHANLPIMVFISPNLPIGDDNSLLEGANQQMASTSSHMDNLTPPSYGEHLLDQLYNDIDPGQYIASRGVSGVNTPMTARSRSVSYESAEQLARAGQILPPQDLMTRLSSIMSRSAPEIESTLVESNRTSPRRTRFESESGVTRHSWNSRHSRRVSHAVPSVAEEPSGSEEDSDPQTSRSLSISPPVPEMSRESSSDEASEGSPRSNLELSVEDLSKVPSYSTALHSNSRMPLRKGLPSYQAAVRSSLSSASTPSSMSWALRRASHA